MASVMDFSEFLAADGVEYDTVEIRGGAVRIGSITAEDWVTWTEMRQTPEGRKASGALLIVRSLVDAAGNRIGDDTQAVKVQKMSLRTTETLLKAIFKLNNIAQPESVAKNV